MHVELGWKSLRAAHNWLGARDRSFEYRLEIVR